MFLAVFVSLVLALIAAAQDNNIPASPSNSSSYQFSPNTTQQLVLGLPITQAGANDPPIFALTDVASNIVPRDPSTLQGIGDHLWDTNPSTSKNISDPLHAVAFISCDPSTYNGNIGLASVLQDAITANVSAVLFYSQQFNFCNLNNTLLPDQQNYGRYYSMVNPQDAQRVEASLNNMLAGHEGAAEVMTQAAYQNVMNTSENQQGVTSTPSTAVAMIILYSITGVITALFLVIIITGAVRAHRHPERYGPHNVLGRPRQSRAKGLARAMLDTIPIVKFGDRDANAAPKPGDVEMGAEPSGANAADGTTEGKREEHAESSEGAQQASDATAEGTEPKEGEAKPDGGDENVSCSICTEDFERGQDIRVLPCNHKFHPACVDPWLLDVSGTCPLCRVDLRPAEERKSTEEQQQGQDSENNQTREGQPLPPPLNPGRDRRRDTIRNFLDPRRMQSSNREERISALQRWRQHTRRSRAPVEEAQQQREEESSNREEVTRATGNSTSNDTSSNNEQR